MRLMPLLMIVFVVPALLLSAASPGQAQEASADAVAFRQPPWARSGLFGTEEVYSADNAAFIKWNTMLARHRAQLAEGGSCEGCVAAEWRDLVARLSALPFRAKLEAVNAAVNRHPYVTSMRNWSESNRWETPLEFLRKGGQCQDYAIAKYLALRAAGVPADRLRLVVLRDMRLGIDHAVTVAYDEGEPWVLDNQSASLVTSDNILHYQPYYSISEQGWWLHRGPHARYAATGAHAPLN
ncbi:MAG TPA: transglutaminase-like cysteine peptidase [Stellaceae bacterium]|nr:transglutaminase-like cysteine peptidase [Stellaceae bacterium]